MPRHGLSPSAAGLSEPHVSIGIGDGHNRIRNLEDPVQPPPTYSSLEYHAPAAVTSTNAAGGRWCTGGIVGGRA